jgi:hypothetical protein
MTDFETRQPNASCFNFFAPAQNILKSYGRPQTAHLQAAQADPQPKFAKEPSFPSLLLNLKYGDN